MQSIYAHFPLICSLKTNGTSTNLIVVRLSGMRRKVCHLKLRSWTPRYPKNKPRYIFTVNAFTKYWQRLYYCECCIQVCQLCSACTRIMISSHRTESFFHVNWGGIWIYWSQHARQSNAVLRTTLLSYGNMRLSTYRPIETLWAINMKFCTDDYVIEVT